MAGMEVKGLHKYYGDLHVLRGIDLTVGKGESVILLGANGCGKSTLLRCLNGLTTYQQGSVTVAGQALEKLTRRQLRQLRCSVGVVFQQFNLVQNVSVLQNVLFGAMGHQRLGLMGTWAVTASDRLRSQAMEALDRVGLAEKAAMDCRQLSGGQQQRVAIARTLMQDADIIIADEPVASLDPRAGREIMDLLMDVASERSITVLCTLHQLELVEAYGDRIVGMKAGRIILDQPRKQVSFSAIQSLYAGDARVDPRPQALLAS
ncbi:MAG: phosphonate ABC transporter ATP-binding protein [Marinobacter sp.]